MLPLATGRRLTSHRVDEVREEVKVVVEVEGNLVAMWLKLSTISHPLLSCCLKQWLGRQLTPLIQSKVCKI